MFIANLAAFTGWNWLNPEGRAALPTAAVDSVVWWATHVFVDGKFYTATAAAARYRAHPPDADLVRRHPGALRPLRLRDAPVPEPVRPEPTFGTGGWRDLILFDLVGALYRYGDLAWTGRFFKVLGIFLLGLWTGRRLYGIGMGLWQRVGPLVWTGIGLVLFAGQVAASAWWLRRFRYGPMEWLWRRLTYGQPLPMRAPTTSPAERRSTLP